MPESPVELSSGAKADSKVHHSAHNSLNKSPLRMLMPDDLDFKAHLKKLELLRR